MNGSRRKSDRAFRDRRSVAAGRRGLSPEARRDSNQPSVILRSWSGRSILNCRVGSGLCSLPPVEMRMLTGWFLVNILGPVALPVFGILPLALLPLGAGPLANVRLMATVKDGQLCWAVVAMSASTIYELWDAIEAHRQVPTWAGFALTAAIFIMLPAMLLAAGGAVFSTPLLHGAASGSASIPRWLRHYKVFVASLILTLVAAAVLTNLHFSISSETVQHSSNP